MPTVIVVGAGYAGLGAAATLAQSGVLDLRIVILEGSDRVGGRAHTKDVPGLGRVEMGATYFHGTEGHPTWNLAMQHSLPGLQPEPKEIRWGFVQPRKPDALGAKDSEPISQALKRFSNAVGSCAGGACPPADDMTASSLQKGGSGGKPAQATIGDHLLKTLDIEAASDAELHAWRWHELQLRINTAAPCTRAVGTRWWDQYHELPGANWPFPGGMQTVAELLTEGLDIRHGQAVTKIEHSKEGVKVTTADGKTLEADHVVCTISLGVLKAKHKELFSPALPEARQRAIAAIGFGLVEKIFVEPEQPPETPTHALPCTSYALMYDLKWPCYPTGFMGDPDDKPPRSPQEMRSNASGRPQSGHHATGGFTLDNANGRLPDDMANLKLGTADTLPFWATGVLYIRYGGSEFKAPQQAASNGHTNGAKAAEVNPPKGKYTGRGDQMYGNSSGEVAHLAANYPPHGLPVAANEHHGAVMWLSGEHAVALDEASDKQVVDGVQSLYSCFPAIPKPQGSKPQVHRSTWGNNELFLGSYSYLDGNATPEHVKELGASVDGRLFFAGEATSNEFMGTMHGAYTSGQRAAQELISQLQA